MKLYFDETEFEVEDTSKTIVEIAKDHGVFISAPCFYNKRSNGCCNGCIIEVNGIEMRACETMPEEGMNIIYDRDDLIQKRTRNLTKYAAQKDIEEKVAEAKQNKKSGCGGHGACGDNCTCD